MAQRLLNRKSRKVVTEGARSPATATVGSCVPRDRHAAVLVGTYKDKQLVWIKRHGIYNYPVKDGDEFDEKAFASIKELWLYADVKGTRHAFEAEFIGKMTRAEFCAANPTYAKLGPSKNKAYYVFKTTFLDYGPRLDDPTVIVRTADFGGRSAKVKKAIEQFKTDGEFAPLEHYLPSDLAQIPRNRLRVCEAAVQLEFWDIPELRIVLSPLVPFPPKTNPSFTFIDLFAGVGGIRMGFQDVGGECVFSSEWNEEAAKTYQMNFGEHPQGDITKIPAESIPDFDVLLAGFPCQPFSISGKMKGFADTRGTLFFEVCRIIEVKKPKVVFLENVKHLVHHDNGRTLEVILSKLSEFGYKVSWKVLNGSDFGVPQNRERIIIVGSHDSMFDFSKIKTVPKAILADFLDESGDFEFLMPHEYTLIEHPRQQEDSGLIFAGYRNKSIRKVGVRPNTLHLSRVHKQPNRIYSVNGIHPTLPSQESSGRYFILTHENKVRKLTIDECWRIMGFPREFVRPSVIGEQYKQLGNSVCVPMIRAVAKEVFHQLLEKKNDEITP